MADNHATARTPPKGLEVGAKFSKDFTFSADHIRHFAGFVGDTNLLHHDEAAAAASPFGRLIAAGTHTFSVMLACVPDYLSPWQPNLGLEASVRMLRPVLAGDRARANWELKSIADTPKLKGWIVTFEGELVRDDGVVALKSVAKTLVFWSAANGK